MLVLDAPGIPPTAEEDHAKETHENQESSHADSQNRVWKDNSAVESVATTESCVGIHF